MKIPIFYLVLRKTRLLFAQQLRGYFGAARCASRCKVRGPFLRGVKLCVNATAQTGHPKLALCCGESKWEAGLGKMAPGRKGMAALGAHLGSHSTHSWLNWS